MFVIWDQSIAQRSERDLQIQEVYLVLPLLKPRTLPSIQLSGLIQSYSRILLQCIAHEASVLLVDLFWNYKRIKGSRLFLFSSSFTIQSRRKKNLLLSTWLYMNNCMNEWMGWSCLSFIITSPIIQKILMRKKPTVIYLPPSFPFCDDNSLLYTWKVELYTFHSR